MLYAKKPLKIALTGPPAAGKSTLLKVFHMLGYPTFSADVVVKRLSRPCQKGYHRLVQNFGKEILAPSGELDRQKIMEKMLEDQSFKKKLENILHPLVKEELLCWFEKEKDSPALVAEIPLLFQVGWDELFDLVIFLSCPRKILLERLRKRLKNDKLALALLENYEKGLPPTINASQIPGDLPSDLLKEKVQEILLKHGLI